MELPQKNVVEWVVFGLSLLLVVAVLVVLGAQAMTGGDKPAQIVVATGAVKMRDGQLVVPVSATNQGDQMTEDIVIEVSLERPGGDPEMTELNFARIVRYEQVAGEAVFPPGDHGQATAAVRSYTMP